ncbi:MAG: LuxR C-terminal-related transcriptional regulator [Actinomycetota bacterium]|nr:LuxR C-terminal-related transcriptional regulator [Actinomycetota bacterium]
MPELADSSASDPVEAARRALDAALAAVTESDFADSIQAVTDEMPVAFGVDFANIRVLGLDRRLHLVAASGCTTMEIRRQAFHPLPAAVVREMLASGGHDDVARSLGIAWIRVEWVEREETLGTIAAGARSKRRPDASGVRLLAYAADRLREPFTRIDRRGAHLRACSVRLARAATPPEWPAEGPVANLRRRERQILELYADGLSTGDIAELLVISPHTVRTHVKLALRRLGVHQRDEAAAMVRADQVVQLI